MEGKQKAKQKAMSKMNKDNVAGEEPQDAKRSKTKKKGYKKSLKSQKFKSDHLSMQDNEEMNNSWESAQDQAMKVDLSGTMLPGISGSRAGARKSKGMVNQLYAPSLHESNLHLPSAGNARDDDV